MMKGTELQRAQQVGALIQGPTEPSNERRTSAAALSGSKPTLSIRDWMHCCGVQRPRWKFMVKMIRAERCIRHTSAPTRSSGVRSKPLSQKERLPPQRVAFAPEGRFKCAAIRAVTRSHIELQEMSWDHFVERRGAENLRSAGKGSGAVYNLLPQAFLPDR